MWEDAGKRRVHMKYRRVRSGAFRRNAGDIVKKGARCFLPGPDGTGFRSAVAMKVLLINGSPHKDGCTYTALAEVEKALQDDAIETRWHWIGNKPVPGCIACMHCRISGECIYHDAVNELNAQMTQFQGIVVGSPVYYAGPTGQVCSFLDRLFFAGNAVNKDGMLAASVVSCRRGGATAAFDRLNKYFTIANMPVVASQYWNMVHGHTPDDVRKDEEGLQTMRTLGYNMASLLRAQEAAEKAGVEAPRREDPVQTNFIR